MKLLTKQLEKTIPAPYKTDGQPDTERRVYAKFFDPTGSWTWYVLEYDPEYREFYGYVVGIFNELGYFSLDELSGYKGPFMLGIERDMYWDDTTTLAEVKAEHGGAR